ncbi:MAG TPA: hypothetical protein VNM68_02580 [Candidatus Polarisedimenticolia bacterium]|nr:hypothetical protein [Candidatus Polarisedimenticolia bacterium]
MAAAAEMASLIRRLGDSDLATRTDAATEIFERGAELARVATEKWLTDPELADCFIAGTGGFPETTVGVAIQPETFERLRTASGSPRLADVPPDQDADEFELSYPGGVQLDLLTTRQPGGSGAIARYLRKSGEGIQQVELYVRDAERATMILRTRFGLAPVYPTSRAGADGARVNFFLVPAGPDRKVLIELVEARNRNS